MPGLLFMTVVIMAAAASCSGAGARGGRLATTGEPTAVQATSAESPARQFPVQYTYKVKAVYPHDTRSYTQGLYWSDGYLWEGTGQYGESALKKVELESGRVVESKPLGADYFGEGIALLDGRIYQLTWLEQEGFIYDSATMERVGGFSYAGEGWGLTSDGQWLYMSDGSNKIYRIDPDGFRKLSEVEIRDGRRAVNYLNELEWIDGRIWANVYMTDNIVIIDPATGRLEGMIDMSGLLGAADRRPETDVLNGIAYDPATGRIFVTGKYWPKLFEIEIEEK